MAVKARMKMWQGGTREVETLENLITMGASREEQKEKNQAQSKNIKLSKKNAKQGKHANTQNITA